MEIREWINDNPKAAGGITAATVVIAAVLILWQGRSGSVSNQAGPAPKAFFTVDDGKTYFPEDLTHLPPFATRDGKTAYRVRVGQCGTGAPFVSHLEKYADEDKKSIEAGLAGSKTYVGTLDALLTPFDPRIIVKKPLTGDKGWITLTSKNLKQYEAVSQPKCANGSLPKLISPP